MINVSLFYIDAGGYFWVFSQNKEMLRFKTPKLLLFFLNNTNVGLVATFSLPSRKWCVFLGI